MLYGIKVVYKIKKIVYSINWLIDYLGLDEEYFNEERIKSLIKIIIRNTNEKALKYMIDSIK